MDICWGEYKSFFFLMNLKIVFVFVVMLVLVGSVGVILLKCLFWVIWLVEGDCCFYIRR